MIELTDAECEALIEAFVAANRAEFLDTDFDLPIQAAVERLIAARVAAVVAPVLALADKIAAAGITCECGHYVGGDHNGRGCYAVVTYSPLVRCSCTKTDAQDEDEIIAARIRAAIESTDAPAALAQIKAEAEREAEVRWMKVAVMRDGEAIREAQADAWDAGWTYAFEDHGPMTHNPYRGAEAGGSDVSA